MSASDIQNKITFFFSLALVVQAPSVLHFELGKKVTLSFAPFRSAAGTFSLALSLFPAKLSPALPNAIGPLPLARNLARQSSRARATSDSSATCCTHTHTHTQLARSFDEFTRARACVCVSDASGTGQCPRSFFALVSFVENFSFYSNCLIGSFALAVQ